MKMKLLHTLFLTICATTMTALADQWYPAADWQEKADPLASPYARKGGTLRYAAFQPPKSLNSYIDNNTYTRQIFDLMYETLLAIDPITTEFIPYLAKRWCISDDLLTYTFELNPHAKWSDGKPITSADIKWTFDQIMNPKNATGPTKVMLGVFKEPEVLDERTVRFTAKEKHWRNLLALGSFEIMPKHAFENQDFNRLDLSDNPIVSGPYVLSKTKEQIEVQMTRRPDWWAADRPMFRNTMNFDKLVFRYYSSNENAFEAFKKGKVDVYAVYTAHLWANETTGERFDNNWIVKQRVHNYNPIGFQGFALNMRRKPFDDIRVRKALAHLVDRETMNRTLMFNAYFLHRSYCEDLYDEKNPCKNTFYEFNIEKAKKLLYDAGYRPNPETGLLEKDGEKLCFHFLDRDGSNEKFLALCNQAFKKIGITMEIERKDFAAWMRDMDEFNFDVTWASWSSVIFRDPEDMWSSKEADRKSGNNLTGFKDPRVDKIIEKMKTTMSITERNVLHRQIDALIAEQVPYVLLWNIDAVRLLYWDVFGTPSTILSKYDDERSLIGYWWYDEDSAAELKEAMRTHSVLPDKPVEIYFDSTFKGNQAKK